jgi:hypothetical protein
MEVRIRESAMARSTDTPDPLNLLELINRQCNVFEDAWRTHGRPAIEDFLAWVEPPHRQALLAHLIPLDADYRRLHGEVPSPQEYLTRFPDLDPAWLAEALRDEDAPDGAPFLDRIAEAGVLTREQADAVCRSPGDLAALVDALLARGELTAYQARALCSGDPLSPLVLGDYVVLDHIASGGMGSVYRARHRESRQVVALKVMPLAAGADPVRLGRFRREVKAASRLDHPNIVRTLEAGQEGPWLFLAAEFVDGPDLARVVGTGGPLSVPDAVDAIAQAARGLAYAHGQGVIHRDVKPSNLLRGSDGVVRVADVGLARLTPAIGEAISALTASGALVGTADYIAPEQARDARRADARSDVYGLGCTLHFLLTGRPPFGGKSRAERVLAHADRPIPSLAGQRADIPPALDSLFHKMLAKDPADRPQSMAEVLRELEACRSGVL